MLIKSDPTSTNLSPAATACGNCGAEERRLLHQVRHRSIFRRLCTTCVLRLHPQVFCPTCFQVYPPTLPNDAVRTCVKCYSHSHSHCVETAGAPPPNPYVCPLCVNPSAPIFKLTSAKEASVDGATNGRVMDRDAAKMLLAAAKIASTSMNKAAVAAKAEAERRVKEAAYTRKRAKEALEHVAHLVIKEKARRKEAALGGPTDAVVGRGFGGIVSNGNGYTAPPGKIGTEITANRNGSMAIAPSVSRPFVVVEEKISNSGNVDRDNSNQVMAALNAVELRENEKTGVGVTAQGDDHTPMDVNGDGMRPNDDGENVAGLLQEMKNDSGTDQAKFTDLETGAGNRSNLDGLNNEIVSVHPTQNKENDNGGEPV